MLHSAPELAACSKRPVAHHYEMRAGIIAVSVTNGICSKMNQWRCLLRILIKFLRRRRSLSPSGGTIVDVLLSLTDFGRYYEVNIAPIFSSYFNFLTR